MSNVILETRGLTKEFNGFTAVDSVLSEVHSPVREQLRLSNVHAFYGESHILHGVDMTVNRGELVTLLGRNGAGRSTILKSIMGMVGRRTGSICINGEDTIKVPAHQIARLGVGFCPEERGIFASLNVEENLMLPPTVASGGLSLDDIYSMFPNLYERRKSQGTRLSGGEDQPRLYQTGGSSRHLILANENNRIRIRGYAELD